MSYQLNIKEVTYSLSEALDFVGIDDNMHGKRVAYMAAKIAEQLNFSNNDIDDIIFCGMLHDCGVSSTDVHTHLVNELDWDNSQTHCQKGYELLLNTPIYHQYAEVIRYHHTHWNNMPDELNEKIKIHANLIYLVDRVDAIRAQMNHLGLKVKRTIQETITKYSGTLFADKLVDAFLQVSSPDSFWFFLETEALNGYLMDWSQTSKDIPMKFKQVKEIALMFSAVVDAKSTFTSEHSIGVSLLARFLAEKFDLSKKLCDDIELAGLLHDLGKLRVKDSILNKPGMLNADERLLMNKHGFDSNVILQRIKGFKNIAYLASLHHETLDAKGYPYHLEASQIPSEARIITIADIFQALIQNRPYRSGLSAEEAFEIINDMTEQGKLDKSIVQLLFENLNEAYTIATHRI